MFGFLILAFAVALPARADIVIPHMGRLLRDDVPVQGLVTLRMSLHTRDVDAAGEQTLVWEETPTFSFGSSRYRCQNYLDSGGVVFAAAATPAEATFSIGHRCTTTRCEFNTEISGNMQSKQCFATIDWTAEVVPGIY